MGSWQIFLLRLIPATSGTIDMVHKFAAILTNVVALAMPGLSAFELGVVCEVFGIEPSDVGLPSFDFAVVSEDAARLRSSAGFFLTPDHDLSRASEADLVCVPAAESEGSASPAVIE